MKENGNENKIQSINNSNEENKKNNNSNLNYTKVSSESSEFRELNKEIFQTVQQDGNYSGLSKNNFSNNSANTNSNNNSNLLIINEVSWGKKNSPDNKLDFEKKIEDLKNKQNLNKVKIETINIKDTIISNSENCNLNKDNNINVNEQNMDEVPQEMEKINPLHFQECKNNNLSEINKNEIKSNYIYPSYEKRNFIPKSDFTIVNNNINTNINNNNNTNINTNNNNNNNINSNNNNNININNNNNNNPNINNNQYYNIQTNNNIINQNFIYYPHYNNYYYFSYMLPQNAFTYNKKVDNLEEEQRKRKNNNKKLKDKFEQTLFTINLDLILKGYEKRTTIMIRHIPNKYSSDELLNEIDFACKGKYDFFYLPLDPENNCNLGYSFINFIDPLHIIHFYLLFKSHKWKYYKSHKECDLSYAKFQGKIELTAHLEKNMNKMEKKKLPMLFNINNPLPKIDLPKNYFKIIQSSRPEIMENINFID